MDEPKAHVDSLTKDMLTEASIPKRRTQTRLNILCFERENLIRRLNAVQQIIAMLEDDPKLHEKLNQIDFLSNY